MNKIMSIAGVTFKEGIREKIFSGILIFGALLLLTSGFLADLSIGNTLKVVQDLGMSEVTLLGIFIALFLSTHLIAKDLDKKTIYLVITKPISRWQYLVGKFFGLCLLTSYALFCSFIIFLIALLYFWKTSNLIRTPDIAWGKHLISFIFINIRMYLLIAISIFFSSFASSALVSFFFSLLTYFIAANLGNVQMILNSHIGEKVSDSLKLTFKIAYWLLPNLSLIDYKKYAIHDIPIQSNTLIINFCYALTYIIALVFFASVIFDKREFN